MICTNTAGLYCIKKIELFYLSPSKKDTITKLDVRDRGYRGDTRQIIFNIKVIAICSEIFFMQEIVLISCAFFLNLLFNIASIAKVISDGTCCLSTSVIGTTVSVYRFDCSNNGGGIGVLSGQHIHRTYSKTW